MGQARGCIDLDIVLSIRCIASDGCQRCVARGDLHIDWKIDQLTGGHRKSNAQQKKVDVDQVVFAAQRCQNLCVEKYSNLAGMGLRLGCAVRVIAGGANGNARRFDHLGLKLHIRERLEGDLDLGCNGRLTVCDLQRDQ
ncbi:hypothetical protein D3C85_1031570 [compost metagenome]